MKVLSLKGIALITLLVAAPTHGATQAVEVRDSAGIRVVENGAPMLSSVPFSIDPLPLVEIGSVSGENGTDFGTILSARLLPSGYVAVSTLGGREIRLFDQNTGAFVRFIGRGGQGPGEFGAAPMIAPSDDGGIWAWDPGNQRISLFATDGSLRSEHRFTSSQMNGTPNSFTMNAWQVSPLGRVLSTAGSRGRGEADRHQSILLIDADRSVSVGIGQPLTRQGVRDGPFVVTDPFTSPVSAAMLAGKVYVTRTGAWQVDVYDTQGQLLEIIRSAVPRSEVTRELRSKEREALEREYPDMPEFARLFDRLPPVDSTSAIKGIRPSPDGTIWVLRWHPRVADDMQVFDVIDPLGQWLGTVRLPFEAGEVADVTADRVLTIWRDSLGVSYVRIYRSSASMRRQ